MSSTVSVNYASQITVTETFSNAQASDNTATFAALNETGTLNAGSTVPATKHATFEQALTVGAATIDLTALPGITADETVDATGLKAQAVKFRNKSTNANAITIAAGASNGYNLLGAAFSLILLPGQSIDLLLVDAAPDVAGGAKEIDLTGTGSQVLECHFVFG